MVSNDVSRNHDIRERLKAYTVSCRIPLCQIGIQAGMNEKVSQYLVSRFLNGRNLNSETLDILESYLVDLGY